ncbi:hypothetical protein BRL54_04765 [Corynebacterium ulcerans]|nr:hypothetical protein BRL54_04765 [Corynebacterium ulcerans]
MPGIGPRTAAQILMTIGDMSDFPSAGHLASYAGLSPRTNQSETSIMSNSLNRAGNKKLKNALWQSSFASIRFHERSRQFYERKRKEGKRHNAAVVALARRRLNVLYAMMTNHEYYREEPHHTPQQPRPQKETGWSPQPALRHARKQQGSISSCATTTLSRQTR